MAGEHAGRARSGYHRGNTRADAIAAGHALLASEGIAGITTVAVASQLDVSRAAVARVFPSITDLHRVLAEDCVVMLGKALAEADDRHRVDAPEVRWMAIGQAYLDWSREHPHEYALVFRAGAPGEPRPLMEETGVPVPDAFGMGLPPRSGDPATHPAFTRWALLHGLATLLNEGPLQDLDTQTADRLVAATLAQLVAMLRQSYGE